ncbi:MAG: DnaJ domain-containing protein [Heliobacteriaceae bacterium]|jgi:DnaJ-class molecular chaperone|nr:DnaJ domain-containing protein [Heliobacteriaceae bacterium]
MTVKNTAGTSAGYDVEKNLAVIINKNMTVKKNYYEILGITPDTSSAGLKAAYKRLARKHHPDVNGDEKIFKAVCEAYETLSDAKKRKQYDILNGFFKTYKTEEKRTQKTGEKKENAKHFTGMFDEFTEKKRFKEEAPGMKNPEKGKDIYADVSVTAEEVIHGTSRTVNIMHTRQCPKCQGRKFINGSSCPECSGKGELVKYKKITVKIPPNIKNGSKLRVSGEGSEGANGGKNGDLYLSVKVEGCSKIKYDGANILYSLPITPFEAALGCDIAIPAFEGNIMLKIPPRTNSGQKFRLAGQGLGSGTKSGDMIVTVSIEIPPSLSEDELRLYEKLRDASGGNIRGNILND